MSKHAVRLLDYAALANGDRCRRLLSAQGSRLDAARRQTYARAQIPKRRSTSVRFCFAEAQRGRGHCSFSSEGSVSLEVVATHAAPRTHQSARRSRGAPFAWLSISQVGSAELSAPIRWQPHRFSAPSTVPLRRRGYGPDTQGWRRLRSDANPGRRRTVASRRCRSHGGPRSDPIVWNDLERVGLAVAVATDTAAIVHSGSHARHERARTLVERDACQQTQSRLVLSRREREASPRRSR